MSAGLPRSLASVGPWLLADGLLFFLWRARPVTAGSQPALR